MPRLYLEYIPFGSLEDQRKYIRFSYTECCQINYQCLSALEYLHGKRIVHRDIKPENILVQNRDVDSVSLWVKLSDFGLSKEGSLKSFCGSRIYLAPEIRSGSEERYTEVVDIWSLGVVVLEFAYGLPHPGYPGRCTEGEWCEKVANEAEGWKPGVLIDLVQLMLAIEPIARPPAAQLVQEASHLLSIGDDRATTPTTDSNALENAATASNQEYQDYRYYLWEDQETIHILPNRV